MVDNLVHQSYKRLHEDFISNNNGTKPEEVLLTILPNIISLLLSLLMMSFLDQVPYRNVHFLFQFLIIIIPTVLNCTVLSHVQFFMVVVLFLAAFILNSLCTIKNRLSKTRLKLLKITSPRGVTIITDFRALVNLISVVCILAVDFKAFPRKFAKTETVGYSLMDTGVGLFVIANALTCPEARGTNKMNVSLYKTLKGCSILLILGITRGIAVEMLEYQEHVSEYGVHWNFFITLAFVKLFTSMIPVTITYKFSTLFGLWILGTQEYLLSIKGWKEWVFGDTPRDNFLSANREGLVSLPGYIGLYLLSISIGKLIHSSYKAYYLKKNHRWHIFGRRLEFSPILILFIKLFFRSFLGMIVTLFADHYFGVSRRLANIGYCFWLLTLSMVFLMNLIAVEYVVGKASSSEIYDGKDKQVTKYVYEDYPYRLEMLDAINYNGLIFFLLGNLLTGAINESIQTLYVDNTRAVLILIGYVGINMFIILNLYRYKIRLRI